MAHHENWLVPPPRLAASCIDKIITEKANCTLIVPTWKSAPFWPSLINKNGNYKEFITDYLDLGRLDVVVPGKGNNGCFSKYPLAFSMLALRCAF